MNIISSLCTTAAAYYHSVGRKLEDLDIACANTLQTKAPSKEILDKLQPILERLQSKDKINLQVRSIRYPLIDFCVSKGHPDNGVVVVNEDDLKELTEEELHAILSHEWAHIVHEDCVRAHKIMFVFHAAITAFAMTPFFLKITSRTFFESAMFSFFINILARTLFARKFRNLTMEECRADQYAITTQGVSPNMLCSILERAVSGNYGKAIPASSTLKTRISRLQTT